MPLYFGCGSCLLAINWQVLRKSKNTLLIAGFVCHSVKIKRLISIDLWKCSIFLLLIRVVPRAWHTQTQTEVNFKKYWVSNGKLVPVSFTIRLCCKRKVTEATASGYCLSTASNVRNLFDFHINLMHPHHWIINRGEKFPLYTEEYLGITFLFPPATFPLCSVFSFSFSPGVYTYHLSSLFIFLKAPLKAHPIAFSALRKTNRKNTHSLPGIQRAPLCIHHSPRLKDSCSYIRECFLYSCLQHRNKRLGKQQYPSTCQP